MIVNRVILVLVMLGTFASLLAGWSVAWWHDRRQKEREQAERTEDQ